MPLDPEALFAHRELAGLTQTELAQRMGSSQGYIADLESGRRGARPQTLKRLAKALGVPIKSLVVPRDAVLSPSTVVAAHSARPHLAGDGEGSGSGGAALPDAPCPHLPDRRIGRRCGDCNTILPD